MVSKSVVEFINNSKNRLNSKISWQKLYTNLTKLFNPKWLLQPEPRDSTVLMFLTEIYKILRTIFPQVQL